MDGRKFSGAPSERVPGRSRRKFEIADVVSEPESKPSTDWHYDHLLIAGRKCRHAETSYDISSASDAVELLIDRVSAWQVVHQHHRAGAVGSEIDADC